MQTTPNQSDDFVASFAMQRQRLLHHAGSLLAPDGDGKVSPEAIAGLSQTLLTSLEMLKVAEEELRDERRKASTAAAAQERRIAHLAAMFDRAPTPLVLTTLDSSIREANQAASRLFATDAYDLNGRTLLSMVSRGQQSQFREQLAIAIEMGSVAAWSFTLEPRRTVSSVVIASVQVIEDAAVGARALYWNIRPASV